MELIALEGGNAIFEFNGAELSLLADVARVAEYALKIQDGIELELPAHLQGREDLSLIAGLWRSLLRVADMTTDRTMGFDLWRFHQLRYEAGRAEQRASHLYTLADEAFPHEAERYRQQQEKVKQTPIQMEYAPRTSPRPTHQQAGELKGEALEQLIGTEQVTDDTAPSEGGAV